ncbi:casein kinase 2 regulatory subunit [Coemansia furcata]|nr:casein kinase 2 regulatory subunit [Coemansia furcata]
MLCTRLFTQFESRILQSLKHKHQFVVNELSSTDSESDYYKYWIDWFVSLEGNEYFCAVDEEYVTDRFNLTNLNTEVLHYQKALELITDNLSNKPMTNELREQVEKSAMHLYGLVHARYIMTARGLSKMYEKYKHGEFGLCPRYHCSQHPLIPVGLSDVAFKEKVKLYCSRCEDIYCPKSRKHGRLDGAYFGTGLPHMIFLNYPANRPAPSEQRYVPRIFGFKIHEIAELHRWQDEQREEQKKRLGITSSTQLPA